MLRWLITNDAVSLFNFLTINLLRHKSRLMTLYCKKGRIFSQLNWAWAEAKKDASDWSQDLEYSSLDCVKIDPIVLWLNSHIHYQNDEWFSNILNTSTVLPGSESHVPHSPRGLGEKKGVQQVRVLDKRYDIDVYSLVKSGQIPSSEEVGPQEDIIYIACLLLALYNNFNWL